VSQRAAKTPDDRGVSFLATAVRVPVWIAAVAVLAVPFVSPGSPVSLVRMAVEGPSLKITGNIDGLSAGVPARLALTLHSAGSSDTVVTGLTARVTGSPNGCPATSLTIKPWEGRLLVPAHGTATASLPVALHVAPGECVGATWQLAYAST
jgi:hypothetical protein